MLFRSPWIDSNRLMEAVQNYCPDTQLTEEEKRRNVLGKIYLFAYDATNVNTVYSPNPNSFPHISRCLTSCQELFFQKESYTLLESKLIEGTILPAPGFPSLRTLIEEDSENSIFTGDIKINVNGVFGIIKMGLGIKITESGLIIF